MSDEENSREIKPPIIILPGVKPEPIAKHYANLHTTETGKAYDQLGYTVKTDYQVKEQPDGSSLIRIIEHLTKK